MRRYFIILAVIVAVVIGGYALWKASSQQPLVEKPLGVDVLPVEVPSRTLPVVPLPNSELDAPASSRLSVVSDRQILRYWFDSSDHALHIFTTTGELLRVSQGEEERIFALGTPTSSVTPSPRGEAIIIETGYPTKPLFSVFNLTTRKTTFLPTGTTAAAWNPSGTEVVIMWEAPAASRASVGLYRVPLKTFKPQLVLPITLFDIVLDWPQTNAVFVSTRFGGQTTGGLWRLDLQKKTMVAVLPEVSGFLTAWTVDGKYFFETDAKQRDVGLVQPATLSRLSTGLSSVPEKCAGAAAGQFVCAAPALNNAPLNPLVYLQRAQHSTDTIILLSLRAGELIPSLVYDGLSEQPSVDATQLRTIGNTLYFVNRYDQKLYSLPLED